MFADLTAPRWPSFDEEDVSDKPAFVQAMPRFTPEDTARLDEVYRQRVRTLQAVDETVETMVELLRSTGRLADTYLVFASDNGWLTGQHRIQHGKGVPYEESIRMPLYVRGPGVAAGSTVDHLVGNVDLPETFAAWAGVAPPDDCDGRSLAPLLGPGAPGPEAWRQAYPLRFDASTDTEGEGWPNWRGVRTRDYTYAKYVTGEQELYDNRNDPFQLRNLAATADPALLQRLASLTDALASCAGEACRKLEDAPF
jgi:arylsulfatase A-like enzyme